MILQLTSNNHSKAFKNSLPINNSSGIKSQAEPAFTPDIFFSGDELDRITKKMQKRARRQAKTAEAMKKPGFVRKILMKLFLSHEELMRHEWYQNEPKASGKSFKER